MYNLLTDLLRSAVTDILLVALLYTMSTPRYKNKWIYYLLTVVFVVTNVAANGYFYLRDNYSGVAAVDLVMLAVIGFVMKPFASETIMPWCFNYLSFLNIYAVISFLSYVLCGLFPSPVYGVIILRVLLFTIVIALYGHFLRPLHRQVTEHWSSYIFLLAMLLANFLYYLFGGQDVLERMSDGFRPLLLLILLSIFIYLSIYASLRALNREYALREENSAIRSQEALLQSELAAHDEFVAQARLARHDLRHHNALLSEYLAQGDIAGAKAYLAQYDSDLGDAALTDYCQNQVVNAVLHRFERRAKQNNISFTVAHADIPKELPLNAPETGILFSNLLENGFEACEKPGVTKPYLLLKAYTTEFGLQVEMRNAVTGETKFDADLYPISSKRGGGNGTRSMLQILKPYGGLMDFDQRGDVFISRLLLPLR